MREVIAALKIQMELNRSVLDGANWRGQRIVPESAFSLESNSLDASVISSSVQRTPAVSTRRV